MWFAYQWGGGRRQQEMATRGARAGRWRREGRRGLRGLVNVAGSVKGGELVFAVLPSSASPNTPPTTSRTLLSGRRRKEEAMASSSLSSKPFLKATRTDGGLDIGFFRQSDLHRLCARTVQISVQRRGASSRKLGQLIPRKDSPGYVAHFTSYRSALFWRWSGIVFACIFFRPARAIWWLNYS